MTTANGHHALVQEYLRAKVRVDYAQKELDKARKEIDAATASFKKAHQALREVVSPPAADQRVFQIGEKLIIIHHSGEPTATPVVEMRTVEKIS